MKEHEAEGGKRAEQAVGFLANRGMEVMEVPDMATALTTAFSWLHNVGSSQSSSAGDSEKKYVLCVTGSLHAAAAVIRISRDGK